MGIQCPNCKKEALLGSIFCPECGTRLDKGSTSSTQSLLESQEMSPIKSESRVYSISTDELSDGNSVVVLQFVDSDQILYLKGKKEYTIGRSSEDQKILPDIDLTPFNAFERGVSRIHAILREIPGSMVLIDLGSSNGTRVNGQKLNPHEEAQLQSGDIIALGRLKMRTIIRMANG